jgi:hypothetical protein
MLVQQMRTIEKRGDDFRLAGNIGINIHCRMMARSRKSHRTGSELPVLRQAEEKEKAGMFPAF